MPLAELTGPPAVGKSALVAAGVRLGAVDARRSVLRFRRAGRGGPVRAPDLLIRARGPLRAAGDRLLRTPDDAEMEAALASVAVGWAAFLRLTLDGPGAEATPSGTDPVLRLVERGWALEAVRLRALLEAGPQVSGLRLLDEGLTHPYKALTIVGSDSEEAVRRYAECVPLPDTLVVVDDATDAIVERFRARYRAVPTRARWAALGPSPSDARLAAEIGRTRTTIEIIASAAEARGCEVVRLDTPGATPLERAQELLGRLRARTLHADDIAGRSP